MAETRKECGYLGHVCGLSKVQFISRYREQNDYCVNGSRVSLNDSGEFGYYATEEEKGAVRLFLLEEYADYLRWRNTFRARVGCEMPIQEFTHSLAF